MEPKDGTERAVVPSSRKPGAELVKALLPFAAIPVAIATYVAGLPGLTAVVLGAVVVGRFIPDFMRGNAERHRPVPSSSGVLYEVRSHLEGWSARLSTGRYLLVALIMIGGGLLETASPGWAERFYRKGHGWPWTVSLAGALLAATSIVQLARGTPATGYKRAPLAIRLVVWLVYAVGFALGVALLVGGVVELAEPGTVRDWIGDHNPLGEG